jgi:sulfate permease, SulP family
VTPRLSTPFLRWAEELFPFLRWRDKVTPETLRADTVAGLVGAVVVLPQGVAFATLAGLPPQYGLYAAIVPAIVAALFGSSWHLVSGPTNIVSIVVFASVSTLAIPGSPEYIRLVLTLTFLAGTMQLAMGLARIGTLVNFISHTVVVAFTAGAAFLIIAAQLSNFFGVSIPRDASFPEAWRYFLLHLDDINPYATAVGLVTLAAGVASRRWLPRFPYMIAAMVAGTAFAAALSLVPGETSTAVATVGTIPAMLPQLSAPDLSPDALKKTLSLALAVTILALTEAVSIARAIAVKSGQRIDNNQEFIGQGLSNIAGSFFSAYVSSGSFNRSGLNYEAGARTPLAGVFSALGLVAILLAVAPLISHLPLAAMAAVLFLVAYGLIDMQYVRAVVKASPQEAGVMLLTFLAALLANLEFAIYAGVIMSLMVYLARTARPLVLDVKPDPAPDSYHFSADTGLPDCPQLKILRINGSLFFGAVDHIRRHLERIEHKHVLIVASGINFVDMAGAQMLAQEAQRRRGMGGGLYFYRVKDAVRTMLARGGYLRDIGEENLFGVKSRPVGTLYRRLDAGACSRCTLRIFRECHERLPNGEPVKPLPSGG